MIRIFKLKNEERWIALTAFVVIATLLGLMIYQYSPAISVCRVTIVGLTSRCQTLESTLKQCVTRSFCRFFYPCFKSING